MKTADKNIKMELPDSGAKSNALIEKSGDRRVADQSHRDTGKQDKVASGILKPAIGADRPLPKQAPTVKDTRPPAAKANQPVSVDDWVVKITNQISRTATDLIELGQLFIDAKSTLQHGQWLELFQPAKLRFSPRTAQKLMKVANHAALAKTKNSSLLPPSLDALALLARLDTGVVQCGIDDGAINADMSIVDVKQFVLDQQETPSAKAEKPFVYDASLQALVKKVNQTLDKVPTDQRLKFSTALVKAIGGPATST